MIDINSLSPDTIQIVIDLVPVVVGALVGSEVIAHSKLKSNGWVQLGIAIFKAIFKGVSRDDGKR